MQYAIANRNTGQVMPEYGTFATKQDAIDFILYDRLMDSDAFYAGTGMLYITDAAALTAATERKDMNLESYKPYASSEAEAQEIVRQMDAANWEGSATYSELKYAPGLWAIGINHKGWVVA
jgi:hypothetical protein